MKPKSCQRGGESRNFEKVKSYRLSQNLLDQKLIGEEYEEDF
jgi:hypothetical protein